MARIRTIKPEFWTSEQVIECSPNARLLFIGLWNFCDDAGRHSSNVRRIKAEIFPGDDFSSEIVRRMIDELVKNGLLVEYEADGQGILQVTGWRHQKIDRPQKPRYPGPDELHSSNDRGIIDDHSRLKGKGRDKEGKGEEVVIPIRHNLSEARAEDSSSGKNYAFETGVIRLTQKHLDQWRIAFPNLSLESELTGLAGWAQTQPSWFQAVSGALAKRQRQVKLELDKAAQTTGKPEQRRSPIL